VEFRLLGTFQVEADGVDLTPPRRQHRALLALLLLHADEVVASDDCVEALWGEHPPETAQTALHGHVSALRKRLGPERIETQPPGYLLRLQDEDSVDIRRFEHLAAEPPADDRVARSEQLRKALALFSGEPLADFRYEAFASQEAARLDELRLMVIEEHIQTELELGRHEEVVLELERLIVEHPLREGLRAQLMLALYRAGRQADALEAFQDARVVLRSELGLDPSPALQRLEHQILNQDPELAAPDAFAPARHPASATKPSGIVTFLLTDAEHSARELVRTVFGQHGGFDVQPDGDSLLVAFARARDAVAAAVGIQRATRSVARLRIGISSAEAIATDEGYTALAVRGAASIRSAAHPGQILLSQTTRDLLRETPLDTTEVLDLGEHRLTDLAAAQRLFQLVVPDLEGVFPPPRTLETRSTNLPLQPTPLVGREREIREVAELVRRQEARVVTLTGTGGTGKTRLAAQVAAELLDDFPDGVFFVSLAPLANPSLVLPTVARTLGVPESGADVGEALARHMRERQLLLLLDNFEHLLEVAPATVAATTSSVKLLVTSRVPLHLATERVYPVSPLQTPDSTDDVERLLQCESVALFASRAQSVRSDFAVTTGNALPVAEICTALAGLPLAIELAATRVGVLPPAALLERLNRPLKLLKGGAPDAPERHRTIRATIDWSFELLEPDDRLVFMRLAVFVGGCTLEAAESVCGDDLDVVDGLASLTDSGLIRVEGTDEAPRFTMLEPIREYAVERLEESGEAEKLRGRHAAYFLGLAEEAEPNLRGSPGEWLDRLEHEHDNFRAALDRLEASGDNETALRLAAALWRFWYLKGHLAEGRRRLESVLPTDEHPTAARARALNGAAVMAVNTGDTETAKLRAGEALALHRKLGDAWGAAYSVFMLGAAEDDAARAQKLYEDCVRVFREHDDEHSALLATRNLAAIYADLGHGERARALYEDNLARARATHNDRIEASTLGALAMIALDEDRLEDAASLLKSSLRIHETLRDVLDTAVDLCRFASVLARQGRAATAARLLASFESLGDEVGIRRSGVAEMNETTLAAIRTQLDDAAIAETWEQGLKLTVGEAVTLALDSERDRAPDPAALGRSP
jgi:predicted ATPase/DNA-binding SARP family transcriptional activator